MTDEQLNRRIAIKRLLIVAAILILVSCGLFYFRISTEGQVQLYHQQKSQEASVQAQVEQLTSANNQLMATIEENGKELVSFSEDKIKYINLASELSLEHNVVINKLTVSDVWQEGEMSGMTTSIEVEGQLTDVRAFVEEYCGVNYTNRINVVSCRPSGRYVWLSRGIDEQKVLSWFDLSEDEALYQEQLEQQEAEEYRANQEFGLPVAQDPAEAPTLAGEIIYDPASDTYIDSLTGSILTQDELEETPITLEKMFADAPMKVYLVIDFLGRA